MFDRHDVARRSRRIMLAPVLVSECVTRDHGRSDEMTWLGTWTISLRSRIAAVAKLVLGAWRAGSVLEERRVLVDVRREAVHRRSSWAASGWKMLRRSLHLATVRLRRTAMALWWVVTQPRARIHSLSFDEEGRGRSTRILAVQVGASVHAADMALCTYALAGSRRRS